MLNGALRMLPWEAALKTNPHTWNVWQDDFTEYMDGSVLCGEQP